MKHPLERWLNKKRLTQDVFALRAGLTQPTVSRIISGARVPDIETVLKIEAATGGTIGLRHLTAGENIRKRAGKISPRRRKVSVHVGDNP